MCFDLIEIASDKWFGSLSLERHRTRPRGAFIAAFREYRGFNIWFGRYKFMFDLPMKPKSEAEMRAQIIRIVAKNFRDQHSPVIADEPKNDLPAAA